MKAVDELSIEDRFQRLLEQADLSDPDADRSELLQFITEHEIPAADGEAGLLDRYAAMLEQHLTASEDEGLAPPPSGELQALLEETDTVLRRAGHRIELGMRYELLERRLRVDISHGPRYEYLVDRLKLLMSSPSLRYARRFILVEMRSGEEHIHVAAKADDGRTAPLCGSAIDEDVRNRYDNVRNIYHAGPTCNRCLDLMEIEPERVVVEDEDDQLGRIGLELSDEAAAFLIEDYERLVPTDPETFERAHRKALWRAVAIGLINRLRNRDILLTEEQEQGLVDLWDPDVKEPPTLPELKQPVPF